MLTPQRPERSRVWTTQATAALILAGMLLLLGVVAWICPWPVYMGPLVYAGPSTNSVRLSNVVTTTRTGSRTERMSASQLWIDPHRFDFRRVSLNKRVHQLGPFVFMER